MTSPAPAQPRPALACTRTLACVLRGAWWRQWGWIAGIVAATAVAALLALTAGASSTTVANLVTSVGVIVTLILTIRADTSAALRSEAAARLSQDNAENIVLALAKIAAAAKAPSAAELPRQMVRWSLKWDTGDRYILVNIGDAVAKDVQVSSHESLGLLHVTRPGSDLQPDEALTFLAVLTFGTTDTTITVTWRDTHEHEVSDKSTWRYPLPGKPRP